MGGQPERSVHPPRSRPPTHPRHRVRHQIAMRGREGVQLHGWDGLVECIAPGSPRSPRHVWLGDGDQQGAAGQGTVGLQGADRQSSGHGPRDHDLRLRNPSHLAYTRQLAGRHGGSAAHGRIFAPTTPTTSKPGWSVLPASTSGSPSSRTGAARRHNPGPVVGHMVQPDPSSPAPAFLLAGREDAVATVMAALAQPSQVITVDGPSRDEALAVVCASFSASATRSMTSPRVRSWSRAQVRGIGSSTRTPPWCSSPPSRSQTSPPRS